MTLDPPNPSPEPSASRPPLAPIIGVLDAYERRNGPTAPRFLDATWTFPGGPAPKLIGRLPGAVAFGIDDICDRQTALPHMLPGADDFARAVERLGISSGDDIVVYDRMGVFSAPRVWWTFKAFGHDRVFVLDGGLPAWAAVGLPYEPQPAPAEAPAPGRFAARLRPEWVADADRVETALAESSARVLDARPAGRFRGEASEPRAGLRSGHMPGAGNLPFSALLGPDGRLLDPVELKRVFEHAGLTDGQTLIASCGSGVTASILALAAAVLGQSAAVYDGSWAEWGGDLRRCVVTGPT